jgi:uncharacterized membrane protein YoaK (UPF0700 family)
MRRAGFQPGGAEVGRAGSRRGRARAKEGVSLAAPPVSRRNVFLWLLTAASGATDALSFLALGQTFTAVITGNLVFLGVAVAHGSLLSVVEKVIVVPAYALGIAVATGVLRLPAPGGHRLWPRGVTRALAAEATVAAIASVLWFAGRGAPHGALALGIIFLFATAMGMQSGAAQGFGVPGLSTTYFTGTLTYIVRALVHGESWRGVGTQAWAMVAMVAGAAVGAGVMAVRPAAAVAIPLALIAAVAGLGERLTVASVGDSAGGAVQGPAEDRP